MDRMFIALCGSLLWLSGLMGQAPTSQRVDSLTVAGIMRDPAWIGHAPEDIRWSLDGKEIYFQWNPAPVPGDSLYVVSPNGGKPTPVPVALRDQLPPIDPARSPDGRQLVYALRGDLYLSPAGELQPQPLTQTLARERNPQFDLAGERIFFEAEDNLFALHLATGLREQLTDFRPGKASEASDLSTRQDQRGWLARQEGSLIQYVGKEEDPEDPTEDRPLPYYHGSAQPEALTISPDGRFVTFRLRTNHAGSDRTQVPDYISASGYTETLNARPKVGSGQATFEFGIYDREQDTVRLLETAQIPGISDTPSFFKEYQTSTRSEGIEAVATPRPVMVMGPTWSVDSRHAVVEIRSLDFKDRWLMRLEAASGQLSLLDRQHDEAWIGGPGIPRWQGQLGDQGWLPDHETYWFMSEETGYAHLYTVNVTTGKRRPMTGGSYEVFDVRVGQKGKYWYFNASQVHPGERQFYRLPIDGGVAEQLTSLSGHHEVSLSPDEKTLAIRYSTSNQPWELWVQPNRPGAKPKQLTHSVSEAFEAYPWRAPDLITIPASDGARIHARLYRPSGTAAADKAVIFVHGAGYLQNAHKWWSSYFREYMFHNLLADQGYVVLDIDYRGSAGYGRDWRTEVYRHMGGTDLSDHLDARRFLIDELQVDSTRIGIYGGSYGGFITLMAMFTAPGAFAAGAALRPVTDWAHYNHPYTASMLNQPQDDSLAYHRSSPIYFAEGLTGALLICHGMVDTNVHFQDVVRLNQRLIELGKRNWQVAMYPVEGHGFTEPSSWTDEYRRIYELFEENIGEKTLR